MEPVESAPDRVYKWTVRTLYAVAIGLNVWYLLESYRESPEAKTLLAKANRLWRKVKEPHDAARQWRRDHTAMMVEAEMTVEDADRRGS